MPRVRAVRTASRSKRDLPMPGLAVEHESLTVRWDLVQERPQKALFLEATH